MSNSRLRSRDESKPCPHGLCEHAQMLHVAEARGRFQIVTTWDPCVVCEQMLDADVKPCAMARQETKSLTIESGNWNV